MDRPLVLYVPYLYRLYADDDRLLYVGVSGNLVERLRKHSHRPPHGKAWYGQVAYCTVEAFPSMGLALNAEREAIRVERPLYNIRSAVARGA